MPLVEAFGYTNVKVEGYEADDVIATLAVRAREEGIPVMVVTGDRDAYQLVGDGIRVMSTSRGITETKIYDSEAVIERYGVPPELVTDLMGLRGDTSDNIPGVPGIGEKTAAQLLQKFGTLEDVLANVDEVSGAKRKQNLVEHADDARMSKELATLQYDLETGRRPGGGDGRRARPRRPARLHARVRAAGGDGAPRRGAAGGRRGARPQGRDRARDRGGRGHARRPRRGPGRRWRSTATRWAAADGERIVTGASRATTSSRSRSAARPLVAHDVKSLGGGRHGLLAAAAREGVELELDHDTMVAAYLLEPQRRTYDLVELAADAGIGLAEGVRPEKDDEDDGQLALGEEVEAGLDPAEEARLVAALADVQRPRIEELGLEPLLREVELPLVERAGGDGARGAEARRRAPRRGRRRLRRADRHPRKGDLRAGRGGVHDRLAAAGRRRPLRGARPDPQAPRQDRLLDRRPGPRPDPRRAPDRREDRVLARADQAQEHLPRLAARPDRPRAPAASTPPSTRRRRRPAASPAPTRTCRTSRSGPRSAARSAPASSPSTAPACSRPTTARSSCGSSPTSPTRRC